MTLVNVPLWLPHHFFGCPRPFPRVRALFPASSLDCASRKVGGRRQAAISAGAHAHSGQRKGENLCLPRKREKFKLDVESRFPVPTLHLPPSSHDPTSSPHRTHPAHLAEPPRMPRFLLLPSLNGDERVPLDKPCPSCAVPSRFPSWAFFSPRLSLSAHAELSSGRPLLHQEDGHVGRGPQPQRQKPRAEGEQTAAKPPAKPPTRRHKRAAGATFQNGLLPISGWIEIQGTSRLE